MFGKELARFDVAKKRWGGAARLRKKKLGSEVSRRKWQGLGNIKESEIKFGVEMERLRQRRRE